MFAFWKSMWFYIFLNKTMRLFPGAYTKLKVLCFVKARLLTVDISQANKLIM